ncbi:MAG TPA: MarR family transcriptional regulator [Acidimicrobiales bacterium]|nr:MarR family transcriptional regulator [Acidimicrobiales bacterium]
MTTPTGPVGPVEADTLDVAGRLRTVLGQLGRRLRLTRTGAELSPSQHEVLGTIVRRGPLRLSALAEAEGLNPTMLSRIARKLEGAGLVARTPDARDGRVVHLAATEAGRDLYEEIRTERTGALVAALSGLSAQERRALAAALPVLESLADALRPAPR